MTAPLYEPYDFASREFGFRMNSEELMTRHKAFSSIQKLRTYLIETAPDHVYYSSSRYSNPAAYPMEDKKRGWLGSDLVFDIDYDHLIKKPTLKEARRQADKLLVILEDQLGFRDMIFADSGSRGYHVHVHDKCVQKLDNAERREIVDFLGHYVIKPKYGRKTINPNWVEVDTVVTTDITRLIGLPGSLNVKKDAARPVSIINRC